MATAIKMTDNTTVEMSGSQENTGSPAIKENASELIVSGSGLKVSSNGETYSKPGIMPPPIHKIKKSAMGTAITPPDDSTNVPIINTRVIQKKVWSIIIAMDAKNPIGDNQPISLNVPRVR